MAAIIDTLLLRPPPCQPFSRYAAISRQLSSLFDAAADVYFHCAMRAMLLLERVTFADALQKRAARRECSAGAAREERCAIFRDGALIF
jgi:hypothetical protein